MTHIEWLLYSLDVSLSLNDIKEKKFDEYTYNSEKLQQLEWKLSKHHIQTHIVWKDAHYKFSSIVSKPYIVYSQGDVSLLDKKLIAIVWPRKPSSYLQQVMGDFFEILKWYDVVTISWGAPWIDTLCHELSHQHHLPTVMVLGWWLWYYINSAHRHQLHKTIDHWWLVLSEFRLWEKPAKRTYPHRNRIVAWLSNAVFLPGAAQKSGSLITVDFAHQMHKPIASVPGSIYDECSQGTNEYIGTHKISALTDFEVFLDQYFHKKTKRETLQSHQLSEEEQTIIVSLSEQGTQSLEQLTHSTNYSLSDLMVHMMNLEIQWLVREKEMGIWDVK